MVSFPHLKVQWILFITILKVSAADAGFSSSASSFLEEAPGSEDWRLKPLTSKLDGSLASPEIGNSSVYSDRASVGPLEVVQYHPYNPTMPHKVIALKLTDACHLMPESFRSLLSPSTEYFFVIDRPLAFEGEKILFRPHYWMYRGLTGPFNKNEMAAVNIFEEEKQLLAGSFSAHVHDYVCSPNNMPLPTLKLGEGVPEESHILYSLITTGARQAATVHWIPQLDQWNILSEVAFEGDESRLSNYEALRECILAILGESETASCIDALIRA
jgi:hypothetical protein